MAAIKKKDVSHPHDLLVRNILSDPKLAADFFKHYLPALWVSLLDFRTLKRESAETVDSNLSELVGDLRYSVKFKNAKGELKVFVFLEHQSRPEPLMSFRLLKYICTAYDQHLLTAGKEKNVTFPYPLAVVLHHGKTPWEKVPPMNELIDMQPGAPADVLQFPICLIDLARMPMDELRGHPAVCAMLDSLQSASTGRLRERVTGIFDRLQDIKEKSRLKSWSVALATYYAAIQTRMHGNIDDLFNAFKILYSAKEAEKMTITIAEELRREGRAEGIAKGRAEGKAEGKAEGIAEGKAEGKAEGIAEGEAKAIVTILEARFGRIPAGLKKKVSSLNKPERLEKTLILAGTSQTLKEFQAAFEG